MNDSGSAYRCYRSEDHPEGRPRSWVYAAEMVRPLGICMLPVMIGALVAMLEGLPALGFLFRGAPAAMAVAAAWTWIRVRDHVVEVCVSDDAVSVLSLHDASHPRHDTGWTRLFNADIDESGRIVLTAGHEDFRVDPIRFPQARELLTDCRRVTYPQA